MKLKQGNSNRITKTALFKIHASIGLTLILIAGGFIALDIYHNSSALNYADRINKEAKTPISKIAQVDKKPHGINHIPSSADSSVGEQPDDNPKSGSSHPAPPVGNQAEKPKISSPAPNSPPPVAPVAPVTPPAPVVPACPSSTGGTTASAPSRTSAGGVAGTTTGDLQAFAAQYNAIRVANCLHPVPSANFRWDACMEDRLFWMAEDPSTDPSSAWGHIGSSRSDGVPSVGCDGNLAGGSGDNGSTVAQKWWNSTAHRNSLYKPSNTGSVAGMCVYFAMTHGGVPNEAYSFTRSAARSGGC